MSERLNDETILCVVRRLIGPVKAVGESHVDDVRSQNLDATIELVDQLVFDIAEAATSAGRPEASMAKIGKRAKAFLTELGESILYDDDPA